MPDPMPSPAADVVNVPVPMLASTARILEREAQRRGMRMTELVRVAVLRYLVGAKDPAMDGRIVDLPPFH